VKVTSPRLYAFFLATLCWNVAAQAAAAKTEDDDEVVVADAKKVAPPPPPVVITRHEEGWLEKLVAPFSLMAFLQADVHGSQASEDQVQQGGTLLNEDRFVLKTARVRVDASWKYVGGQLELESNTVHGPVIRPYHVFGTLKIPSPNSKQDAPALASASVGLFDTPFGFEGPESPRFRYFMDRSLSSRAFFPGVPDLGLWVFGELGAFRWSFAAMNGEPLDTRYQALAPVSAKQLVVRVGFDAHPRPDLDISGAVSTLRGRGFHPGTDASKNQITWNDVNEDGSIQPAELVGQAAASPIASQLFDRWAVGADVQVNFRSKLGTTRVTGEITMADNMDRGLYIADPIFLGQDTRELGAHVDFTQEITKWAVVGFRFDYYDPNLDAFDKRSGQLIPTNQTIQTYSPLVGFTFPGVMTNGRAYGKARVLFQYDITRDHLGRAANGVPTDLANDAWTVRLQVEL
jgi:hypothetical protein